MITVPLLHLLGLKNSSSLEYSSLEEQLSSDFFSAIFKKTI